MLRKSFGIVVFLAIFLLSSVGGAMAAMESSVRTVETSGGAKTVHMVTVDLNSATLEFFPILAGNRVYASGNLYDIAEGYRTGQTENIAAINGDYFAAYENNTSVPFRLPYGISVQNGAMLHAGGALVGVAFDDAYNYEASHFKFEIPIVVTKASGPRVDWAAWGVNHVFNVAGETIIYTSVYGSEVNRYDGICAVVRNGVIVDIVSGNAPIPADGYTLYMKDCPSFTSKIATGDSISFSYRYLDSSTGQTLDWDRYSTVVTGGPQVVKNGTLLYNYAEQGYLEEKILSQRAQRSFLAITWDKKLILGTAPNTSMSELGELTLALGAADAINLDGGASSGLYFNGTMLTTPGRQLTNVLIAREAQQRIQILYHGQPAAAQNEILILNGRTYCAVRDITDILGLNILWDPAMQTVTATGQGMEVVYKIGSDQYIQNGEVVVMDARPMINVSSGRTYLPLRFIAEPFGYEVRWDQTNQTLAIE